MADYLIRRIVPQMGSPVAQLRDEEGQLVATFFLPGGELALSGAFEALGRAGHRVSDGTQYLVGSAADLMPTSPYVRG